MEFGLDDEGGVSRAVRQGELRVRLPEGISTERDKLQRVSST